MTKCKHCGNPLYLTLGGKCRMCRRQPGFFRSIAGTTTLTQSGAERGVRRKNMGEIRRLKAEIDKVEWDAARDIAALYQTPVTDGLHGMTWQAAELLACQWMKKNGHWGAKVTPPGADGGIDVESMTSIAQVKHHASPVGLGEMQRLYGIAQSTGKNALFFAASGYSAKALDWAKKHRIECYTYPPVKRVKG
ncbi:restriction endonuclease [Rhodococcus sp. NPDC058481]|uniref:restriction endonuclease n=1 Tax=unclassified Rhodococcus (in: high G+C Gram-positive bacteria) TaxID=192944 RepID=UPI00365E00DB